MKAGFMSSGAISVQPPHGDDNAVRLRVLDYTETPGGRYPSDGLFPGADFLEKKLLPAFQEALRLGIQLVVDLDGTAGYASSFLEEAFGGLARRFDPAQVESTLVVVSRDEPYLVEDIREYVAHARSR